MLYFKNTTYIQTVRIPASGPKAGGTIVLELVNVINRGAPVTVSSDQSVRLVDADGRPVLDADGLQIILADMAATSTLYYVFDVALPEGVTEGEYEYKATVGDTVISCGLAYIGEPKASVTQYDNTVQYEQYRS